MFALGLLVGIGATLAFIAIVAFKIWEAW